MDIELNIRLDVRGARNSLADCQARAYQAVGALQHNFDNVQSRRHQYEYEDNAGTIHLADCLVVRIEGIPFRQRHEYREVIHALAGALEQDCIAVYYPFTQHGELIGTSTGAYGSFDYNEFRRF